MDGWSKAALATVAGLTIVAVAKLVVQSHDDSARRDSALHAEVQNEQGDKAFGCYSNCLTCDVLCQSEQDPQKQRACSSGCYAASERCCNGVGEVPVSHGCGCMDVPTTSTASKPMQGPLQQATSVSTSLPIAQVGVTYVAIDPDRAGGKQLTLGQLSITGVMVSDSGKTRYDNLMDLSPKYSCAGDNQCTFANDGYGCTGVLTFQQDRLVVETTGSIGSSCANVRGQYRRGTLPATWPAAATQAPTRAVPSDMPQRQGPSARPGACQDAYLRCGSRCDLQDDACFKACEQRSVECCRGLGRQPGLGGGCGDSL